MPQLEINNLYSALIDPEPSVQSVFIRLYQSGAFPITDGELSVALVDDSTIARIHCDFMDDPSPTDVITFPADPSMASAGEIIVSVDHARQRSAELAEPFSRELTLYLVHGWLHLAGYDDRQPEDRKIMRAAEQKALTLLERAAALPEFKLVSERNS